MKLNGCLLCNRPKINVAKTWCACGQDVVNLEGGVFDYFSRHYLKIHKTLNLKRTGWDATECGLLPSLIKLDRSVASVTISKSTSHSVAEKGCHACGS